MTTPRRSGRPPGSDSAATRERILGAACHRFAALGYDATTNKDVAADAGITAGALYHYVDSKAALYGAALDRIQRQIYGRFRAAVDGVDGIVARIHAVLDAAVALEIEDPSLAAFVVAVPTEAARHAELADLAAVQQWWADDFFGALAKDAEAAGELAAGVGADDLAAYLRSMAGGLARTATIVPHDQYLAAVRATKRVIAATLLKPF